MSEFSLVNDCLLSTDHLDQERLGNSDPTAFGKRQRGFVLTINNYRDIDLLNTQKIIEGVDCKWGIASKEVGKSGTPHIQAAIYFNSVKSFKQLNSLLDNRAHIEVMKGTKNDQLYCAGGENGKPLSDVFCTKNFNIEEERVIKHSKPTKEMIEADWKIEDPAPNWRPWQKYLLDQITPYVEDRRKIWFIVDPEGGKGKTTLAAWMVQKFDALIVEGCATNIFYAITQLKASKQMAPRFIILNLARQSHNNVSYKALEQIKDRFFFSGKYESGMIQMRQSPTIVVFMNCHPDYNELTKDRFIVIELNKDGSFAPLGLGLEPAGHEAL